MIGSKLLPFTRLIVKNGFNHPGQRLLSTSKPRGSHAPWTYREFTMPSKRYEIWAEAAGGFFWWWVFWHLFTDYGHLIGEFEFVEAGDWTDEELGIPPDDVDDPE